MNDWIKDYNECAFIQSTAATMIGVDANSFGAYLNGIRTPRKKNEEKMKKLFQLAKDNPRIQWNPVYGYATKEQYEKLKTIGIGLERDELLKQIDYQTKNKGKVK